MLPAQADRFSKDLLPLDIGFYTISMQTGVATVMVLVLRMRGQASKLDSSCLRAVSQKWIGFVTRMSKRHYWRMLESDPEAVWQCFHQSNQIQ